MVVDLDLPPGLPAVRADVGQLQQVVMNLVINAAEAIGEQVGSISLRTGVRHADRRYLRHTLEPLDLEPGQYVWLEVRDTGCGMDEATQTRIFDPFFTTKFTGRGLGLAAVAGIVRGHKGAIKVVSEPGKGTSLLVLFPARPEAEESRGHGTVLVVDDEEAVLELTKVALEEQGFRVFTAAGGPAAIELFKRESHGISVVILDLSMPGMSGQDVFEELRKQRPGVKIIVSSGYSEAEARQAFAGKDVSGFLEKPYTSRRLAAKVAAALAGSTGRAT